MSVGTEGLEDEPARRYHREGNYTAAAWKDMQEKIMKISVYLDDGRVYEYEVKDETKAREHSSAIVKTGYRHNDGIGEFEHYGPHRILKVKVSGGAVQTKYIDKATGT